MELAPLILSAIIGYGCAAKKMVAKNADVLIQNQLERRIPIYGAQKTALSKDINQFLNDQKAFAREAVPAITSLELDVKKVDEQYDYLNSLYKKLALNFSKLMSKYMAPLDSTQQKEFHKKLQSENTKLQNMTTDEQIAKIEERFERLFGAITPAQKQIFESEKTYLKERHDLRLKRREELHAKFHEIYQMDLSQEAKAKNFYDAFSAYQNNYPESQKNKEIIKRIIPTLTVPQKEVFEDKVNDIKEILTYYLETDY